MYSVKYVGRNDQNQRTYAVSTEGQIGETVTSIDEEAWHYTCTCGGGWTDENPNPCNHVTVVMEERSEFEAADALMGDASP